MKKLMKRSTAGLAAGALVAGALTLTTFAPAANAAPVECAADAATTTLSIYAVNDFHGRLAAAAKLFTPVEDARAAKGEDNVVLISSGDNIGASTFESFILDDAPTIDVLNAIDLEASAVGNHEFDGGFANLTSIINNDANFPYLGANVYDKGTTTVADPLAAYTILDKAGLKVAVVGAVTQDTPSMVSPDGVATLDFGPHIAAVNKVTDALLDGNADNGEADIVVASFHEGADSGASFDAVDPRVEAIFTAHTHQVYEYTTKAGVPVIQAGQYGESGLSLVDLKINTETGAVCSADASIVKPAETAGTSARIVAVQQVVAEATAAAAEIGAEVIGTAEETISTAGPGGGAGVRYTESPITNMVAQMFADTLGGGDPEFIGIQNPGGTRATLLKGEITFAEAAAVLPFANTLMTSKVTGAQFKEALEQQWQRDADGNVPSRPFLALGLSDNVEYTYDESLPEGERITGVWINGQPINMDKLYTIGSGSFLIAGGDNFRALGEGIEKTDTGRADLEAWVEWVFNNEPLSPEYDRRGVSAKLPALLVKGGAAQDFVLGQPLEGGIAIDTLDMFLEASDTASPLLKNTKVTAYIGTVEVGSATVTDGVATVSVKLPADSTVTEGPQIVRFVVEPSGTEVYALVMVKDAENNTPPTKPVKPGKPGLPSTGN